MWTKNVNIFRVLFSWFSLFVLVNFMLSGQYINTTVTLTLIIRLLYNYNGCKRAKMET